MTAPPTDPAADPRVAHLSGEDAFAMEQAVDAFAARLGSPDAPLERWTVDLEDRSGIAGIDGEAAEGRATGQIARQLGEIEQRLSTAPLFGGGTLVVVRQPAALARAKASRERIVGLIAGVPPGNALAFLELDDGSVRRGRKSDPIRDAVSAAGGLVVEFPALTRDRMERWIERRAGELGVELGPGSAALLAERVGAHVREGDVDRRRQSQLADGELQKLALYRPGARIDRDDVAALVPETIPGSTWAFLDAVGSRRIRDAGKLADRLLSSGTAVPLLVTQLHRRLRELLLVREHLASGTRPDQLPRIMRLQPFRAGKLAEQASTWSLAELEDALAGLLELDLASKGIGPDGSGVSMSDERSALGLEVWLAEQVARPA
jgi:DNA polymerase III delta subunit